VTAIGKKRADAQKGKRRESGLRPRNPVEPGTDASSASRQPVLTPAPLDPGIRDDAARIELLLDQTSERLFRMTETPLRRELTLVVERYRRALGEWEGHALTPVQRVILLDCVKALHDRVVSRSNLGPNAR
jgi:hypothetical protein